MGGLFGGSTQKQPQAAETPAVGALNVSTSSNGKVIPLLWGTNRVPGNMLWYGDFTAVAHSSGGGGGGGGGGKGGDGGGSAGGSTTYTYTASFIEALCEGPIIDVGTVWSGKTITAMAEIGGTVITGTTGQSPWTYLTSAHPAVAMSYSDIAYAGLPNFDLGSSPNTPNLSFEIKGPLQFGGGVIDALPSAVIADFLAKAAFPTAKLGILTAYATYCQAQGLFISPVLTEQKAANATLQDWATTTNSEFVWSSGQLTLVPYGDTAVTGNGATFTPNLTPQYDLADDDFIHEDDADPVICTRADLADAYNQYSIEYLDRSNAYNPAVVTVEDQAHIDVYGLRPASVIQAHHITSANTATLVARMVMARALWVRAVYEFKLTWKHSRLDAMDLVTISDPGLGLSRELVRITEIEEDEEGLLSVKAEEVPGNISAPAIYANQVSAAFAANFNVPPGSVSDVIFFDAPAELTQGALEAWMLVCGGPDWGGCQIHLSSDGIEYKKIGAYRGNSVMGSLTAALPLGTDPDTAHSLAINLAESRGSVIGGTQADADSLHTLAVLADSSGSYELISYQTATLTGASAYTLGYLRRGAYNTAIGLHASGAKFGRLDGNFYFPVPYTKDQIGKTIYVKLVSFNAFDSGIEDISTVAARTHVIAGPPRPPAPTGVSAVQSGNVINFGWNASPDYAMDIAVGPQGVASGVTVDQAWSAMSMVTEAARGSYDANASIQPGNYTFGFRLRNPYSDQLSAAMVTVDLVVSNALTVVSSLQQAPAWAGTMTGFVRHYTGVLIPDSTLLANQVSAAQAAAGFIPSPVAVSTYDSPVIDTGAVDQIRLWATIAAQLGPGSLGNVNTALAVDWSSDGVTWQGAWKPWSVGTVIARYAKFRLIQTNDAGACVVTGFAPTADVSSKTDIGAGAAFASPLTIAVGGTAITFTQPFHVAPNVQVTPMGTGMTGASAINVTATGCTLHGWTGSSDMGGLVSWKATGP